LQTNPLNLDLGRTHLDPTCFVAPNAIVIGSVSMGAESSIWYQCVLRGDVSTITIGERTNIQDGAIVHADPGFPTIIGNEVTVGHGAIVHGAVIEDGCLIGIRATLLNGCRIGAGSVVGAGALVPEGMIVPPNSVVMGMPGRIIKEVGEKLAERSKRGTAGYVRFAKGHKEAWDNR
jgi:carbonic anhydrase/acetyltransferase-like protein (isoleucine patch superfamily)